MTYVSVSHKREIELTIKAKAGDDEARNALVEGNIGLVRSIAKQYVNKGIEYDDLVQEGSIGLMKAVDKFDPTNGARLSTYSYMWIKRQIQLCFTDLAKTVKVPEYVSNNVNKVNAARIELSHELGYEPSRAEIAAHLEITERDVELAILAVTHSISADTPIGADDEDEIHLQDTLSDESKASRNDLTEVADRDLIEQLLERLSPRDQSIIRMRYGLDGEEEMTCSDIGFDLGFNGETIRQAEQRALIAMRKVAEALA